MTLDALHNTYRLRAGLEALPVLVKKQRRLERKLAPLEPLAKAEKELRDAIDALLVAAGLESGQGVTCAGYDVVHRSRQGNQYISRDLLLAAGVDVAVIDACVDRYKAALFATVKPMKGSLLA